jgi:hypothetical protein
VKIVPRPLQSHETDGRVSGKPVALVLGALLVGAALFKWWPSDGRAVRQQLDAVADTLTIPSTDTDLSRVARLAEFRGYFAPDVRVHFASQDLVSRDALLALVEGWSPPPGGVFVELADETLTLPGDDTADVHLTAKITARDARTGEPAVEVHDTEVRLAKRDGDWVITSVESPERPAHP